MKYISYCIILVVISAVGWTTDNSLRSIFPTTEPVKVVVQQPGPEVKQEETFSSLMNSLVGE